MDWLGTYTFDSLASSTQTENALGYQDGKNHQMSSADLEENFTLHKKRIKKLHAMCEEQRDMIQQVLKHITMKDSDDGTQAIMIPPLIIEDPNGERL